MLKHENLPNSTKSGSHYNFAKFQENEHIQHYFLTKIITIEQSEWKKNVKDRINQYEMRDKQIDRYVGNG